MFGRLSIVIVILLGLVITAIALPALAQEDAPSVPDMEENHAIPYTDDSQINAIIHEHEGKMYSTVEELENGTDAVLATGGPDEFGYTWDDSVAFSWINVSEGTNTGLNGWGDYTGPIALPFAFKFYENTYSQVYITSSGYLSFDDDYLWMDQDEIPSPYRPNNVIAPYWTPTYIPSSGRVSYKSGGASPNRFFVVEWHDIKGGDSSDDIGGNDTYRFQVILYENGNIVFQYHTMTYEDNWWCGSSGIEDETGQDGLTYIDFCDKAPSNKAVRFYRPAPSARIKVSPLYQGSFTRSNLLLAYEITIRNTGELGPDTYDIATTSTWPVTLYHSDGSALTDTDGDTVIDTGAIAEGAGKTIHAQVQTPVIVNIGDRNVVSLTATSSLNVTKSKDIELQATVPAPFLQAFMDDADGAMSLYVVKPDHQVIRKAAPDNTYGYDMAIAETPGSVYAWSEYRYLSDQKLGIYEIKYTILNDAGVPSRPVTKLVDHSLATVSTYDYYPAVAVAPNGNIGVLWYRYQYNSITDRRNYNIWFAVLNSSGNLTYGPVNLTNYTTWWNWDNNVRVSLYSPRITATADNHFVVAWNRDVSSLDDIYFAVRNSNGAQIKPITKFTNATNTSNDFIDPTLTAVGTNRALLAYDGPGGIFYAVLNSTGGTVKSETPVGGYGWDPDAVQYSNGNIIIAWEDYYIDYAVLDSAYNIIAGPTTLNNPAALTGDTGVSVTADQTGNAILTWTGYDGPDLYYALINSNGVVQTQPTIFYTAGISPWGDQYVETSFEGYGNTSYTITPSGQQVDTYIQGPSLVGVPPAGVAGTPIEFGNQGLTTATSVSVSAALDTDLSYVSDNSGVIPVQNGQTLTWNFPSSLAFLGSGRFNLVVNVPNASYGEQYPVLFEVTSAQTDANPIDNSWTVNVMVAHQIFTPILAR